MLVHLKHHRHPLPGREFLRTEHLPHRLTEHLGRRTRYRSQASSLQPHQHLIKGQPVVLGEIKQLLGRKGMQMQPRCRLLQQTKQAFGIGQLAACHRGGWVESALDAELGGSSLKGLGGFLLQVGFAKPVGAGVASIAAEGAEAAVLDAVV